MYISLEDRGAVFSILKNWPERWVGPSCSQERMPECWRSMHASLVPQPAAAWARWVPCLLRHTALRSVASFASSEMHPLLRPARRRVKAICLTDGSRVGTRFDMGVQVRA